MFESSGLPEWHKLHPMACLFRARKLTIPPPRDCATEMAVGPLKWPV